MTDEKATGKKAPDRPSLPEIEITPEMVEAGVAVFKAWWTEPYGGDDDPMLTAGKMVSQVFSEMTRTLNQALKPRSIRQA